VTHATLPTVPSGEERASSTLDADLWDDLVAQGRAVRYQRGSVIFLEGDRSTEVYLVVSGRVKLSACTRDGRELAVGYKQAGDLFGELAAIDGLARSATATALDPVTAVSVPAAGFLRFLEANPALALPLLRLLADRLRAATSHQIDLRTGTTISRVAGGLVDLADRTGISFDGPTTVTLRHDDLAAWVGVNREAVSRALAQLRARGLVVTRRGKVELIDLTALRELDE
jgi:CRP-like cAMP-binding protein